MTNEERAIYIVIAVIVGILIIVAVISYNRAQRKCKNCGEVGLELVLEKEVDRYNSTKTVNDYVKNKKGEIIRTVEKQVPVTMIVYSCLYRCKFCGHEEEKKVTREK